jgi:ABC-type polysaccharide/polyol phosphate transport system ATPase subunit
MDAAFAIEIRNLSKEYLLRPTEGNNPSPSKLSVLEDLNFTIHKGQCIGIVGPNGCGKSTLLKLLTGITKPTSGEIEINGRVASILDIGAGFHPELSGYENIFLHGQIMGFKKSEIEESTVKIIEFSGIEKFIHQPVKNYSNGMYLRLAFSIMVHLDFDIYLIDEVINVGDQEFQEKANARLQMLKASKTIVITSHDWNSLNRIVNQIVFLDKGKMTEFKDFASFSKFLANDQVQLSSEDIYKINSDAKYENRNFSIRVLENNQTEDNLSIKLKLDSLVIPFHLAVSIRDVFSNTIIEYYLKNKFESPNHVCAIVLPIDFYNAGTYFMDLVLFDSMGVIGMKRKMFSFSILPKEYSNLFERKRWGVCQSSISLEILKN